MKTVTLDMLREKEACLEQRMLFVKVFGIEVVISEETLKQHPEFDYHWAAENFLNASAYKAYDKDTETARKVYREVIRVAHETYFKASEAADRAYRIAVTAADAEPNDKPYCKITDAADRTHNEAMKAAITEWEDVCHPALMTCREVMAAAFARAFLAHIAE